MGKRLLLPLFLSLVLPFSSLAQCEVWGNTSNGGGSLDDYVIDAEVDLSGNQIIVGYFYSDTLRIGDTLLPQLGGYTGYVVKMDSNDHVNWAILGNGVVVADAATDASGNVYYTGYTANHYNGLTNNFPWASYMFVFKYSPQGVKLLQRQEGGGGGAFAYPASIAVSPSGEVAISGAYSSAALGFTGWGSLNPPTNATGEGFLVKYNSNLTAQWAHGFYSTGTAQGYGVDYDLSGNVYFAGYCNGPTMTLNGQVYSLSGDYDGYMGKINSSGIIQWIRFLRGSGDDRINKIKVNEFGKPFFLGYFKSDTVDLDGTQYLNSDPGTSSTEPVVGEISPSGTITWVADLDYPGSNHINEIKPYKDKGLFFTGSFNGADLIIGQDSLTNTNSGFYDFYGGLIDFTGNLVWMRSGGGLANETGISIGVMPTEDLRLFFRSNSLSMTVGNETLTGYGSYDIGISKLKNEPIVFSSTVTNVTCGVGNDGAINVSYTGGQAPYTETWSHGPTGTQISNLAPGNYQLTVMDANGCETQETFSIDEEITLDPTVSVFSADTCGSNNGMAIASVTGGAPPYNFQWSTGSTSQVISNLASGQYTLTVTDANNCEVIRVIDVGGSSPPQLSTSSTPTSTCGSSDGFAIVNVAGQNGPFTIQWSSGQSSSVASGLPKGWYIVDVTDTTGCMSTDSVFVDGPDRPEIVAMVINPSCHGSTDGSIDLSISGGVPAYSYSWGHGPTTQDVDSLSPGAYTVSITDSDFANNNCVTTDTFMVHNPLPLGVMVDSIRPSCTQSNGSITAFGQGGTPPYKYLWSTGDTISTLFNITSGQYWVRVRDSRQCELFRVIDLEDNVTFTTSLTTFNSDSCSQNTGVASVTMIGGQFPFSVQWSNGGTGPFVNQLPAGPYSVTITDNSGCSDTLNFNIAGYNKPFLSLSKSDAQTCDGNDGAAILQISGQAGPYGIMWSSGDTVQNVFNLSRGWYSVTVTDTNGCSATDSVEVSDPPRPRFSLLKSDQSCFNVLDGSVDLNILSGTGPFSYRWSNGERTPDIDDLAFGEYFVRVFDSASPSTGCYGYDSVVINRPPEILVNTSFTDANCGSNNGSASITIGGGIPPYDHRWTNGDETLWADSLSAGIYVVEVEDATGCKVNRQVLISDVEAPSISAGSITPVSCFGGSNGALDIDVSGGTAPYSYWWTNGSSNQDISNLSVGPYEVLVVDGDSCISLATFNISQPDPISLSSQTTNTNCGSSTGSAHISASGGTGSYTYVWSNGGSDSVENNLAAGFYTVEVRDQNSCFDTIWIAISEDNGPNVVLDSIIQPTCINPAGSIYITVNGSGSPYTYNWSNGSQVEDLINVGAGTYNLTVANSQGCLGNMTAQLNGDVNFGDGICLVTVDSATGSNLIAWEKNYFAGISHYNIYRESSAAGVYQQIGTVPFNQSGEFVDSVALPLFRSWRYKISSVDSCGVESSLSPEHKTMHLTQSLGLVPNSINLSWDDYQGFNYATYYIYRNTWANGWEIIDSIPSNLNSYTDVIPTLINDPGLFYVVVIRKPFGCDTDKKGKTLGRSRSNNSTPDPPSAPQGIDLAEQSSGEINFYPVPARAFVNYRQNDGSVFSRVSIQNLKGVTLLSTKISREGKIDLGNLARGIYVITAEGSSGSQVQKLVIH